MCKNLLWKKCKKETPTDCPPSKNGKRWMNEEKLERRNPLKNQRKKQTSPKYAQKKTQSYPQVIPKLWITALSPNVENILG